MTPEDAAEIDEKLRWTAGDRGEMSHCGIEHVSS